MLFDLRGRGRRRTVRIVYSGLALLFLLGFIGVGVGTSGGGGIFEIFGGKGSGGGGENYGAQVKAAKKVTLTQPNNPAAWSGLIHATLLQAGSGENYSSTEESFTSKAQPLLAQIQEAWERYLKLEPHHPDPELATEVMRIYTTAGGGLADPAEAVKTLKIEMQGRPANVTLYYDLAVLSYQAKDTHEGDRAAAKALALAPASDKKILEGRLAEVKSGKSAAASGTSTAGANVSGGAGGATTVTIPASKLGKGATKAQTVTIPSSELKTGANGQSVTIPTSSLTKGAATSTSTVPTSTTTAPKK
jgi:hypothetical protein